MLVFISWITTVVSSVLKDCNLNTNSTIFDNVGDLSFKTLLLCLNTQFKDFPLKIKFKFMVEL